MSKPVYSPTDQSRLAGLERRVDRLERRPEQSALPWAYGQIYEGGGVIASATARYLGMGTAQTNDEDTFSHMPYTAGLDASATSFQGSLMLLRTGVYQVTATVGFLISDAAAGQRLQFRIHGGSTSLVGLQKTGSLDSINDTEYVSTIPLATSRWALQHIEVVAAYNLPYYVKPYFVVGAGNGINVGGWSMSVTRIGHVGITEITNVG